MGSDEMQESQQTSEGIAIGGQGNQGGQKMTDGPKGSHRPKNVEGEISIPNQDKSSATNRNRAEGNDEQGK